MTKGIFGAHAGSRRRTTSVLFAILGLVLMSSGLSLVVQGSASAAAVVHKSYVCKYVTTPGGGERLQTGQNPIWVANSALGLHPGQLAHVGQTFNDGQTRSVVIVANTPRLNPEPTIAACPGVVTPDVLFTDSTCQGTTATHASWVGENTNEINYVLTSGTVGDGNTVTITATPKPGFALAPGAQTVFTHTFGPVATCQSAATIVTPSVTFTDAVCNTDTGVVSNPSWTGTNTNEITYVVTSGSLASGSPITITASPKAGFAFAPAAQTTFSHTFAVSPPCSAGNNVEAVVAPVFQDAACPAVDAVAVNLGGQGFLTPAQSEARGNFVNANHVTYTLVGNFNSGGTIHVAASADTGYSLAPGAARSWTHTFAVVHCPPVGGGNSVTPAGIHSGLISVGTTAIGSNTALMVWGYGLAGTGAAVFTLALALGRRRQTVS